MRFKLQAPFEATGDQPEAIRQLVEGFANGAKWQTLLGVTGSGKTFTTASMIAELQVPTLVLSHNKTLAAQLYAEFKGFFPDNLVEYFVSYYDYYQPEAYIPASNTYIEKDLAINAEIERLRLSTTSSLLSGRRDIIVVSSVSCLYGAGNPQDFFDNTLHLKRGQAVSIEFVLRKLVEALYSRNDVENGRGTFRVKGDTVDVALAHNESVVRLLFFGNEIEEILLLDGLTREVVDRPERVSIFPASIFQTTSERLQRAMPYIQDDMMRQVEFFAAQGRLIEAQRIKERVEYDLEMMRQLGYCTGIENYSRYFDGRMPGQRPYCLLDYMPQPFLLCVDESHVTLPQIHAMYGGDRARKTNLVNYGFRLPAALDNRPLTYDEFDSLIGQTLYISATPGDYEVQRCEGEVVEQLIRPTGLLDPPIEVRATVSQVDDLLGEIRATAAKGERTLVTTLTKRMAEHLCEFLLKLDVRCRYLHSDIDTLERVAILDGLRGGAFDALIGVNLLREGLDLPEVSLIAILDADKEGFLRSARSLTQTAGRAARNVHGRVIMYANRISDAMRQTIDETERRREIQLRYNAEHGITPTQIVRSRVSALGEVTQESREYPEETPSRPAIMAAEPEEYYQSPANLRRAIAQAESRMRQAAKARDFKNAASYRDTMFALQARLADLEG